MPGSGSGVGTSVTGGGAPAIIPGFPQAIEDSCVSLVRYAEIIEVAQCAFWGVNSATDTQYACTPIWTEIQRKYVAKYLAEAQDEIEAITGYPLCPTYISDEQQPYSNPIPARWGKIIEAGIEAESDISIGAGVNYATEPATIGPIVTTLTDTSEIRIFYPGSNREITPLSVQISGGNLTIYIPRCRMVAANEVENSEDGVDYTDLTNFLATVDIKRIYTDSSINAELVWSHDCSALCSSNGCSEYTQAACMYIRNGRISSIGLESATYSDGTWTRTNVTCCRGRPEFVRLNYKAGLTALTLQAENAIVRLAHAKMPYEICGCEMYTRLWEQDRKIPDILTAERLNNPFGLSDGAWVTWQFAQSLRLVKGYTL